MIIFIDCSSKITISSNDRLLSDSIKNSLNINDSIKVISNRHTSDSSFDYTIIDYNTNSKFHNLIKEQDKIWQDYEIEEYKRNYDSISPYLLGQANKRFPKEIQGRWYNVYSYKSDFYLYLPCHFYMIYEINDSAMVFHYMDGNYPKAFLDYEIIDKDNFKIKVIEYNPGDRKLVKSNIYFRMFDKNKKIYCYRDSVDCSLLIRQVDINNFPIIYEGCSELYNSNIIEFDKIECK